MIRTPRNGKRLMPGLLVGLVLAAVMIWQSSNAVLSADTRSGPNAFGAGSISLGDDDSGSVLFNRSNMLPGDSVTNCIKVTYSGTSLQVTPVKVFGEIDTDVGGFSDHLDVQIEEGNGGSFGNCTGFAATSTLYNGRLSTLSATNHDFATGLNGFTPAAGSLTRTYRLTVTLRSDTTNSSMGDTATAIFTWEIHSS
ncbi:MAG: hypothetical protein U0Q22_04490 [Acidimicrobiales bacterium]